ncbi:uncharacterized protein LOC130991328 [Salvia miltiorrhiza]|uniref:uncharacterized protein LOC130991328 n=1 Tax=Salvia miltiorrhiza TaxID=226208 RepID=UPI0025AC5025|nr:uncharacterized protein LOC130991328 [Salvia miltiorrhiza]
MYLEMAMSSTTFFSQILLILFGKHVIRYVFATSSVFFSAMTLSRMLKNYVGRGKNLEGFYRKRGRYYYRKNGGDEWHAPTQGELLRFVYSVLTFVATSIDFTRISIGGSVIQPLTAFPAAFASVVSLTALIDLLDLLVS